ncbi:hypothetical protein FHR33_009718 [Nonomuraea dietziae]|uniref:Integral membrane protein n=1 Tax=Nonomuraea dietziae TaxID=65515 RepID=A0A7W5VLT9_9ACTN|nr:hypothetical protein [Nonomuraea dietziae]
MSSSTDLYTYGGWRRSRSLGLGSLDTRQTIMLLAAVLVPLMAGLLVEMRAALLLAPAGIIVALLSVARRAGVLVLDAALAWMRWRWAEWRTHTIALGQMVTPMPQRWDLPGVLAPTRLLDVEDPGRGRIGIVWNQRTGHMTATVLLSPAGALLADPATVNRQVANWGHLLATLADDASIQHAAVTVELVPEPGTQLADHVQGRLATGAPRPGPAGDPRADRDRAARLGPGTRPTLAHLRPVHRRELSSGGAERRRRSAAQPGRAGGLGGRGRGVAPSQRD